MADTIYTRQESHELSTGINCIPLLAPQRGSFQRLSIVHVSGLGTIQNATLYDRQDACDGTERSFNPDDQNEPFLDPKVHQISPELSPSGNDILSFGNNWIYQNQDEQHISGRENTRVYLQIETNNECVVHIGWAIESRGP